ncbi:MAG TPA: sulfatase, partial [Planctomycetaceae bacterium]|nr:sulfatase [Planctomycetaceae bacterium]
KGKIEPSASEANVLSIDLVPTLLTTVGGKPTPDMRGLNLLDDSAVNGRSTIFGEVFEHNAVDIHDPASSLQYRWVVSGNWKLIVPAPPRIPNGRVELYDLARDPHEETNLADRQPQEITWLTKLLDEWWRPGK